MALTPQPIQIDHRQAMAWLSPPPHDPSRPPVVLLHGFPMDHLLWDDVIDGLQRMGRVLAVDLPGFGDSQPIGPVLTMGAAADWLARGLAGWGIDRPIVLVGLSMGGYVAMEFAARYPQRLDRLVLCNTKAETDTEAARQARLEMADTIVQSGVEPLAESMPAKLLGATTRERRPDVVERLAAMIRRTDPTAVAAAQRGMAERRSHAETLRRLAIDVLCISGQEDALTGPAVMRSIADRAPHGQLQVLAAAGHVTPMEAPDAWLAAVAAFLSQPRG